MKSALTSISSIFSNRQRIPFRKYKNMSNKCFKIVVLASADDKECLTMLNHLPTGASVVAKGKDLEEIKNCDPEFSKAECLLVVSGNSFNLSSVIREMPHLKWIHGIFAGLDHMRSSEFDTCNEKGVFVTNAKGIFSSSLAEWVMGAIWYFNKDIQRLNHNKANKSYDRYTVGEIRGKTIGIIGYGDIGCSCAKLAKAYGMRVIAHRRRPELSLNDPLLEAVYGNQDMNKVVEEADYLVIAAALTPSTDKMIGREQFEVAKKGQVIINVGRGKLIDEEELIIALEKKEKIQAAALDVFAVEPLPNDSKLWTLPNVLLSPHNADMTEGFRHSSVKFFTENCSNYLNYLESGNFDFMKNVVNPKEGY